VRSTETITADLEQRFGKAIQSVKRPVPHSVLLVVEAAEVARISDYIAHEMGGRYLVSVGTDERPLDGHYRVSHLFAFDAEQLYCTLQAQVTPESAKLPAITPLVRAANWAEREIADMIGVESEGHPDPRRLMLADDWPLGVHPLRKDVPYDYHPPAAPEGRMPRQDAPPGTSVLPIGPFFPVLEEPAYVRLFVKGEDIVGCDYRGFYSHRAIEKLGESAVTYNRTAFVAERICGICGMIHTTCFCQAVEEAAEIEVPARARYLRSLMLELERIHSHLLWLGIAGHILGFDTVLMQVWRIREPVMWLCEKITGNRKTYSFNLIGGVRRDMTPDLSAEALTVLDRIERETVEVINAISGDTTLWMRLRGNGPLSREDARELCVVGPTGRGSDVAIDARIDHPYAAYPELGVRIQTSAEQDSWGRTLVRLHEVIESIRLVRVILKNLPEGPLMGELPDVIPPGREAISAVEAPRGESIHYVMTGENNQPYRWRVRAPTYPNLQALPTMLRGQAVADMPIALGSIDPCFSCTERVEVVDLQSRESKILTREQLLALTRQKR
jgi:Ni,Fe-hydrogenase III large subunit/Ni,Fe-hydrogenase III component G